MFGFHFLKLQSVNLSIYLSSLLYSILSYSPLSYPILFYVTLFSSLLFPSLLFSSVLFYSVLSICLRIYLQICLSVYLPICLPSYTYIYIYIFPRHTVSATTPCSKLHLLEFGLLYTLNLHAVHAHHMGLSSPWG